LINDQQGTDDQGCNFYLGQNGVEIFGNIHEKENQPKREMCSIFRPGIKIIV